MPTSAIMVRMGSPYRNIDCPNCGRHRVLGDEYPPDDGICEKCRWDADADQYATVSRWRNLDGMGGASCVICHGDAVDLLTGECRDAHWHGLGGRR